MKFFQDGSNFRQQFQANLDYAFRKSDQNTPLLAPPHFKVDVLRDTGNSMSIGNLILSVSSATVSYLIHYDSLLQNTTVLLQNTTVLLQNATILLQNTTVITKCDVFYKNCDSAMFYQVQTCQKIWYNEKILIFAVGQKIKSTD